MENKLINALKYVGIIGASICSVAYIIIVVVLIEGFKVSPKTKETVIFAIVNAFVGFIILTFLKIQGEIFAKNKEENQLILKQYYETKTKDKKYRSMKYFWITSTIKDILTKILTVLFGTFGIVYIVIVGSGDWNLLLLALFNLLLFISFGLLGLAKTYDFFNENMIPYIKYQLNLETREIARFCASNEKIENDYKGDKEIENVNI